MSLRTKAGSKSRMKPGSTATAVLQFAITGTVVVLLLGLVAVELLRNTGTSEAINDSKRLARLAGDGIVAPSIAPGLERGDPKAIAKMDRVIRGRVLSRDIVRVKLWDASGVPYPEVLDRLATLAVERHREEHAYRF